MENNSNKRKKLSETVTLILKEKRFEVEKQKLIDKSHYFATLLSANFLEYGQTEHVINYDISSILLQDFTVSLEIMEDKKAKILPCIISCEHANKICEQYIHCWDGKDLLELTSFEYPTDIIENCFRNEFATGIFIGMQITARRYDLYLCGGEYGIGSGMFNKNIWRYSLISKKWVHETVMPVERRHMITVFLKNKLYLVGGMGRHKKALDTIDIYDIYTGIWTSSAKIPTFSSHTPSYVRYMGTGQGQGTARSMWSVSSVMEPVTLTSDSEYFIFKDTLIIYRLPYFYKYFPDKDVWKEIYLGDICELKRIILAHTPILPLQTMSCYIDVVGRDEMVLKVVTDTCNVEGCNNIIKTCSYLTHRGIRLCIYRYIDGYLFFPIPFFRKYGKEMELKPAALLYADRTVRNGTLHLHSISIQNPRKFRSLLIKKNSARRFLDLLNPAHLHTTYIDHI